MSNDETSESIPQESTTVSSQSCDPQSRQNSLLWRSRVLEIQKSNGSEEVLEKIIQDSSRRKSQEEAISKARWLSRANYAATSSNARSLSCYASARARQGTMEDYSARSKRIQSFAQNIKNSGSSNSRFLRCNDAEEDNLVSNDEQEKELQQLEEELGINQASVENTTILHREQEVAANEVQQNLEQFRVEPSDPDELMSKFGMFEVLSNTVCTIREETLAFWRENRSVVEDSVCQQCDRDIQSIDNAENQSIYDESRNWFVYDMAVKANHNTRLINNLLRNIKSRLEMLAQEPGECPFCLSTMVSPHYLTLSCCHRVCRDCWHHWKTLQGPNTFCPVCRHNDFLEAMVQDIE